MTATRPAVSASTAPRLVRGVVARPRLFALLDEGVAGPVTLVSAPAGSGKTMLVASWLRSTRSLPGPVAWADVARDESDATRFWLRVMDALRDSGAIAPEDRLATLAPAPGGEDEFVRRLLAGLEALPGTVILVIEDLHHLRSEDAREGLEHLLAHAPAGLRTIVVTRRDPKLGLHRLRLAGELTEIRSADLDFTGAEAEELMAAAGVAIAAGDVERLRMRTEGWAAGLRLAALSLARHEDPARFVAEFSGSERTVADYLLGEVLARQPPEVRELLLRTSVLERVTGPLADLLTGRSDGTRLLHELEEANAFVVALDVARSSFRYHHLLVDLLRLELRREAPDEIARLHRLAAEWLADNGDAIEAIRHAELAADWELASELLGRHWVHLVLDGEEATLETLLAGVPAELADADAELAVIAAADRLVAGHWARADALIANARARMDAIAPARRARAEIALATVELFRARRVGGLEAVLDEAQQVLVDDGGRAVDPELQALALTNLGIAESWTLRLADAERHLAHGLALGRSIGRPYIEVSCLTALGVVALLTHRYAEAEERLRDAVSLAERVGWSQHRVVAPAYVSLGGILGDRGLMAEAERWLDRGEAILRDVPEPPVTVGLRHAQGVVLMARGRFGDALAVFREGVRLTGALRAPHFLAIVERQWELRALVRLGELDAVRGALADSDGGAVWRNLDARVRLASGDPRGAADAVAPVLAGDAFVWHPNFEIEALLLDAVARASLGEADAAESSVERALATAEPTGRVFMFLTVPGTRDVLERHPVHRTAHPAHLRLLLDHLAGAEAPAAAAPAEPAEALSERELAVLRFLPTNLSAGDIGAELFLSVHTVKTHMRKLYAKLDVHTRAEAIQRARALGLLGPGRREG
jgi:LuxR family transcriptional regulator, maltose regulon positive regulatory protein